MTAHSVEWQLLGQEFEGKKLTKHFMPQKMPNVLCSFCVLVDTFQTVLIRWIFQQHTTGDLTVNSIYIWFFSIFKANLDKQQLNYCGNLCFKPNMAYSRFKAAILLYSITATPWMKKCISWIPSFNHNSKIFYIYCSLSVKLLPRWGKDQIISMDVN